MTGPILEAPSFSTLPIDPDQPLQHQLHQHLSQWICSGRLPTGMRLPASRRLALELGISRNTVMQVIDQLKSEGYLESRQGSGVYVSSELPDHLFTAQAHRDSPLVLPTLSKFGEYLRQKTFFQHGPTQPFTPGVPDTDSFPLNQWLSLQRRHQDRRKLLGYDGHQGYQPLRNALSQYLASSRGVRCTPEQIIITQGAQQAISICAQVLVDEGDHVLVENPGYVGARKAFQTKLANLIPCPLSGNGLDVEALALNADTLTKQAKLMYITPTHQYPLGGILPAADRLKLLDWAVEHHVWLIEDDYDSEFHYAQKPIAAMQGMAEQTPVIYMGSFSKTLFPALRLGYLVVPKSLVDVFIQAKSYLGGESPMLTQAVVADFIEEGHFVRHLRRMRLQYKAKWQHLQALIEEHISDYVDVIAASAGMHIALKFKAPINNSLRDTIICEQFKALGFGSTPLSFYYLGEPVQQGLVLGFANTNEAQRIQGIKQLQTLLRSQ